MEYDPEYVIGNDYDLWFKMFNYCSFSNLPEVLLKYRTHKKQKSLTDGDRSIIESKLILGQFFRKLNFPFDECDLDIHWRIFTGNGLDSLAIIKVFKYLNRLKQYNLGKNIFEPDTFTEFLKLNWRRFMFFQNHKLLYWLSVILFFRPVQYFKVIRNRMSLI